MMPAWWNFPYVLEGVLNSLARLVIDHPLMNTFAHVRVRVRVRACRNDQQPPSNSFCGSGDSGKFPAAIGFAWVRVQASRHAHFRAHAQINPA